jgi:hypothetical protein
MLWAFLLPVWLVSLGMVVPNVLRGAAPGGAPPLRAIAMSAEPEVACEVASDDQFAEASICSCAASPDPTGCAAAEGFAFSSDRARGQQRSRGPPGG